MGKTADRLVKLQQQHTTFEEGAEANHATLRIRKQIDDQADGLNQKRTPSRKALVSPLNFLCLCLLCQCAHNYNLGGRRVFQHVGLGIRIFRFFKGIIHSCMSIRKVQSQRVSSKNGVPLTKLLSPFLLYQGT